MPVSSLCLSMVRVDSSPSWMSTCWRGLRSIWLYCLAAPIRAEMRREASLTSSSRLPASQVTAARPTARPRAAAGTAAATRSSHGASTPAATSGGGAPPASLPAWSSTGSLPAARTAAGRAGGPGRWSRRPGSRRSRLARPARPAGRRRASRTRTAPAARRGRAARSLGLQVPVDELDGHGALPHRRGDPLDRAGPGVAGREHPGDARLQVVGVALERPAPRPPALDQQVGAGDHEPPGVALDDPVEPVGAGGRADEHEQEAGGDLLLGPTGGG